MGNARMSLLLDYTSLSSCRDLKPNGEVRVPSIYIRPQALHRYGKPQEQGLIVDVVLIAFASRSTSS